MQLLNSLFCLENAEDLVLKIPLLLGVNHLNLIFMWLGPHLVPSLTDIVLLIIEVHEVLVKELVDSLELISKVH